MTTMTVRKNARAALIGLIFLCNVDHSYAEDNGKTVTGAMLYHAHCASCHGEQGRGDGIVGKVLRTPPSDLSLLAQRNGGIFPEVAASEFIDGVREVNAHGPSAMPVWGLIFQNPDTIRKIVEHLRKLQRS